MAKDKISDNDSICQDAVKFLRATNDMMSSNYAEAMEAFRFRDGDQWPTDIQNSRRLDTRPCLTINKLDTYCRQIENNQRQQRPRARCAPTDSLGSKEVAKIMQGMIRHVEQARTGLDLAIDTAFSHVVTGGFGYYRLLADYERDTSFQQEIFYEWIPNPFMVKFDSSSISPDGSDAKECLIGTLVDKKVFKQMYPNADTAGWLERWIGASSEWETKDQIFLAEYYKIFQEEHTLVKLSDGKTYWKDKLPKDLSPFGLMIVDERKSLRNRVMWYKLTHNDILDSREIPGTFIPVFPIYGNISIIDGKRRFSGIVKNAKDPQQMINYYESAATECVALTPKAKYLLAAGADEGFEDEWLQANLASRPTLHYNVEFEGKQLPPPIPNPPAQVPAALLTMLQNNDTNLRSVIGISDPAQRISGNVSGKALVSEQQQSENSVYHFYDNLTRTLRHSSRVVMDWIPHYYPEEAVVRIVGPDEMSDTVTINQKNAIGEIENNINIGNYDIVMETGPGYASKRQEALASMAPMFEKHPELVKIAGDIFFRNMDFPGSDVIADRLASMNPMAQKDAESKLPEEAQIIVKGLQQQLQQAQQMIQQLQTDAHYKMSLEQMKQQGADHRAELAAHTSIIKELKQEQGWKVDVNTKAQTELKKALMANHAKAHDTVIRSKTAIEVARINRDSKEGEEHDEPDGDERQPVIKGHPVHGDVHEEDINKTMATHGLSRNTVLHGLAEQARAHG